MAGSVEVYQGDIQPDNTGWWYFRIKAANGEIVAQSEAYNTRFSAIRGVQAVASVLGAEDTKFAMIFSNGEVYDSADGLLKTLLKRHGG